jgi:hypothetical protein
MIDVLVTDVCAEASPAMAKQQNTNEYIIEENFESPMLRRWTKRNNSRVASSARRNKRKTIRLCSFLERIEVLQDSAQIALSVADTCKQ